MERHALRDDQFARIEHLLPGRPGTVGRNSDLGNRLFVDAVIWCGWLPGSAQRWRSCLGELI
jgi:hypothetical protein